MGRYAGHLATAVTPPAPVEHLALVADVGAHLVVVVGGGVRCGTAAGVTAAPPAPTVGTHTHAAVHHLPVGAALAGQGAALATGVAVLVVVIVLVRGRPARLD